jgi:excisionase family DNA binding protein
MAVAVASVNDKYITKSQACEMLDASYSRVNSLIERGILGTRQLPGGHVRLRLADVEALIKASIRPATTSAGPTTEARA